jgi:NADPH2:quinone reductase
MAAHLLFALFVYISVSNYITLPEEGLAYSTGLYNLISNKYVKINVFKEYPFTAEGVKDAQRDLTGGKTTGKLVIKISD